MRIVSSRRILRTPRFDVADERAEGRGLSIERAVVKHPGAAVMLARDEHRRVLLVRQFRLPARKRLWELPAGTRNPGESALQTARRELREETGCRARRWRKLVEFYPSPGFCDEKMTVYLAEDLTLGEAAPEPDEKIETRWVPWEELLEMIARRRITDGKTLAAVLYARHIGL